jgi:hypothetical protein
MSISYQDFIKENAVRQPEPAQTVTGSTSSSAFFISATAPTSANQGSLWFNTNTDDSKLYVRYDNNWIGIQ